MTLPFEFYETLNDTDVIGDLDEFIAYIDSGQARHDWRALEADAKRQLEPHRQGRSRSRQPVTPAESPPSERS